MMTGTKQMRFGRVQSNYDYLAKSILPQWESQVKRLEALNVDGEYYKGKVDAIIQVLNFMHSDFPDLEKAVLPKYTFERGEEEKNG